jgi:predicted SAM-dependent methyltransferase
MNIRRLGAPLTHALPTGLRDATRQFAEEVFIRKRHLQGLFKARKYRGRYGMAMHLGSGDRIKEGWVNIDLHPAADLTLDLRERLPFAENTFRIIYSEHLLEHFDYPRDITRLLLECYRVLEPGGIHSLAVPDGEPVLRSYTIKREEPARIKLPANLSWCRTHMDCINYFMRQNGEHRWSYDEETMRQLLESVGFVKIQKREFDPELDQEVRRVGSLYMQCKKPGDNLRDPESAVVLSSAPPKSSIGPSLSI